MVSVRRKTYFVIGFFVGVLFTLTLALVLVPTPTSYELSCIQDEAYLVW